MKRWIAVLLIAAANNALAAEPAVRVEFIHP